MLNYMVAYTGVIVLIMFVLNVLTQGFLVTYLRVKASRGKLILTRIASVTDTYYKAGKFEEDFFTYTTRNKEKKLIPLEDSDFKPYISQEMGVSVVHVDEPASKMFSVDFRKVALIQEFDSGRTQSLLIRIKNRPASASNNPKLILLLLIGLAIGLLFVGWHILNISDQIAQIIIAGNIR
jgi:hypothetical protein